RVRGGVRVESRHGPREELPEIGDAARDRAAHAIGILVLEVRRPHRASCENAVAEPRSEALDLPLDGFGAIDGRPGRDVAVRIARVLAFGRPPGVELALLHEQHEGPLGMLAAPDGGLRGRDLVQRATEVYGRGLQAAGVAPRDRPVQRPVELERAGTVAV